MSCILRAWGRGFDVEAFFSESPLPANGLEEKSPDAGDMPRQRAAASEQRLNVSISDAGPEELDLQIDLAIQFLDRYEDELRRLGSFSGVEAVTLEFGLPWQEAFAQTETFPSELLWRAGALDISLQVTHYMGSDLAC